MTLTLSIPVWSILLALAAVCFLLPFALRWGEERGYLRVEEYWVFMLAMSACPISGVLAIWALVEFFRGTAC
jgi:hypothetical protein